MDKRQILDEVRALPLPQASSSLDTRIDAALRQARLEHAVSRPAVGWAVALGGTGVAAGFIAGFFAALQVVDDRPEHVRPDVQVRWVLTGEGQHVFDFSQRPDPLFGEDFPSLNFREGE